MRISSLSMIGVIKAFHAYCVSRGTDPIQHTDESGRASWSACAVGSFTKHIKTPLNADNVYNKYIRPALNHYQNGVEWTETINHRLGRADRAANHYPTYDKLAAALGKLIK